VLRPCRSTVFRPRGRRFCKFFCLKAGRRAVPCVTGNSGGLPSDSRTGRGGRPLRKHGSCGRTNSRARVPFGVREASQAGAPATARASPDGCGLRGGHLQRSGTDGRRLAWCASVARPSGAARETMRLAVAAHSRTRDYTCWTTPRPGASANAPAALGKQADLQSAYGYSLRVAQCKGPSCRAFACRVRSVSGPLELGWRP
jgi:hypothetical protein